VLAQKFLQVFPEIKRYPDYKIVVGDYLRGIKAREQSAKNSAPQRAPVQPRPGVTPAQRPAKDMNAEGAKARFQKSTSRDDLADIIASKFI